MATSLALPLAGKVAIVTASTQGIGLAISRRLAKDGARVVISSRKQGNVDKAQKQLQDEGLDVTGMVCHVGNAEDRKTLVTKTLERNGSIDILISNAAANPAMGNIFDTTEEQWTKIFDTNVKSAFFLAKEVAPHMQKKGNGNIVFVTSIGGYQPFELLGCYSVSKTALLGLVKAMAPQCAEMGIRVNGVAPGVIRTKFSAPLHTSTSIAEEVLKQVPVKRFGEPVEVAGTVSYLVSDDASYVTGETIVIAGGMQSRL
ncbi:PREDICTED: dehydrogenase/reductase SDR family member 4-like [Priapulus caudatus]|uniref:Dehydrogenase/reductase SDR family member 4-like n=1 Tax=Priapulus caudatus TaxID=37621 RepID=A0ABM1EH81_PRICU|nr:PREDICTED: dehydrogenase/reductase SDR family member 4-like [Priapulus caudatus]XP_014671558.1 PREDICTED: dehydrogenase/reductase SDR family member 4-like [Priapulus caudatus]